MHALKNIKYLYISFIVYSLLLAQHYAKIPEQKQRGLQVAHSKLESLHKQMKKRRVPLSLLNELETALELITASQFDKQA